jgi:hypothetical protein
MEFILSEPITYTETNIINKYTYYLNNFILNKEVTLYITFFTFNNNRFEPVYSLNYTLIGDEYIGWGSDDSYIESIVTREVEKVINGENKLSRTF